jgi:hypothetical protein
MIGYKLFRKRKNGTLGPLFINKRQVIEMGVEYPFELHPTKGYAVRAGWHICDKAVAPHLSKKNRVWCQVKFTHMKTLQRPESQGGTWYLGSTLQVIKELAGT